VSHPRISVFAGSAKGNEAAIRVIEGQATLMARTSHDIGIDTIHDEIVVPNPFAEAILFFRGDAKGEEAPIRIIQGPKTKLGYTDNVAVDPRHNEVFTVQSRTNSVLVFRRDAGGNVEPIRIIHGPKTRLNRPARVAVDPVNNLLMVTNRGEPIGLLIFDREANGDAAPKGIISGPKTGMDVIASPSRVTLYPEGKKIFISVSGGILTREGMREGWVGIWKYEDRGDIAPWAIIKGAATKLKSPFGGVALNPEAKEVMVIDNSHPPALLVYHLPEIFR